MAEANQDLVLMVRLQHLYDQMAEKLRERKTPPPEVRELHRKNLIRRRELEHLRSQIEQLTEQLKAVEVRELEWQRELEHFHKQKAMVTNEREFTAVLNEIEYAERTLAETRVEKDRLKREISELEKRAKALSEIQPVEEARHKAIVEEWGKKRERLKQEVKELLAKASEVENQLSPQARSKFRRLLERKQGAALAPVIDGSCSLCHFTLRPHVQQRVRKAQEIIECEHCHRILYLPEHPAFQQEE